MNSYEDGKQWPQFLVVLTATVAVFTTGLHVGWPAPSLPKLLSEEYPFEVSNEEGSYITVIGNLGNFCGSFVGNILLDRIGRRITILMIAVPQLLCFLFIVLSYQLMELLYVGRFLGGIGEGMTITIIYLYTGEIAEPTIRGTLCSFVSITWYFGVLVVNIVGSYVTIKTTALSFLVLPVLFVVLFWKMPESPYYLLMKNREDEAATVLKFLRRKRNVDSEMAILKANVIRQMSETGTYRDIFAIESNKKAFFVTVGARFFQLSTGVSAFSLYIQLLLKEVTQALEPQLSSSIFLLIQVVMTICSTFIVDKWGRKPLLLFSISGCFLNLFLQTIFFVLKEHTSVDVAVVDWFPLVMMILHIILYSIGLGVIVSVLTGEMFSASIKGKLACLVNAMYALLQLCFTKFYQATADGFGLTVPFSSFTLLTFLGILFFYYLVPETKGKSLEEIQQRLKRKPKTEKADVVL